MERDSGVVCGAWCLPSDRIRRGGPLVVSFLFKPESMCSRNTVSERWSSDCGMVQKREDVPQVDDEGKVVVVGGTRKRFRVERES